MLFGKDFRKILDILCENSRGPNPFPNKPWLLRFCSQKYFENTVGKEEIAISPFPSVFYLFRELSAIFIKFEIVVCKLFQFGRFFNLLFGKGLKHLH